MRKTIAMLLGLAVLAVPLIVTRYTAADAATTAEVSFYRLRLEYVTASDWSNLEVVDPDVVLTMRPLSTSGSPLWVQTDADRLALNQDLSQALAGEEMGMVVDYALVPEVRDSGLVFQLNMGSLNKSVVRPTLLVEDGGGAISEQPLPEVAVIPGVTPDWTVTIDLSSLGDEDLSTRTIPVDAAPKTLWALWHPTYFADTWSDPRLIDTPLTPYDTRESADLAAQAALANGAGVDAFLSSWWGPGHYSDQVFPSLLDAVAAQGMTAAVYVETLRTGMSDPIGEEELYEWLAYAITQYGSHPGYAQLDGRPVIGLWATDQTDADVWARVFARLRSEGLDAAYLGSGAELASLELFDAGYDYLPVPRTLQPRSEAVMSRAVRNYPLLADDLRPRVPVMTLTPGYDDSQLPDRPQPTVVDRENGAVYQGYAEAALAGNPAWVLISTWNEWFENTHIEPSERYGDLYLTLTREFAEAWKSTDVEQPLPTPPSTTTPPTTTSTTTPPTTTPTTSNTAPPTTSTTAPPAPETPDEEKPVPAPQPSPETPEPAPEIPDPTTETPIEEEPVVTTTTSTTSPPSVDPPDAPSDDPPRHNWGSRRWSKHSRSSCRWWMGSSSVERNRLCHSNRASWY